MSDKTATARKIAKELASRPENKAVDSPWYCIATTTFASGNFGLGVVEVYKAAIEGRTPAEARIVLRRIKESMAKGCMLFGIPKMLNAFYPLAKSIPGPEYVDHENPRANVKNPFDCTERGLELFRNVYRDETDGVLKPYEVAPELLQLGVHLEYGFYLSELSILGPVETSQIVLGSLIPQDLPTQVRWHMRGFVRNGGSQEQLQYTVEIIKKICQDMDIAIKSEIPSVSDFFQ